MVVRGNDQPNLLRTAAPAEGRAEEAVDAGAFRRRPGGGRCRGVPPSTRRRSMPGRSSAVDQEAVDAGARRSMPGRSSAVDQEAVDAGAFLSPQLHRAMFIPEPFEEGRGGAVLRYTIDDAAADPHCPAYVEHMGFAGPRVRRYVDQFG
eukprot:gene4233-51942_t